MAQSSAVRKQAEQNQEQAPQQQQKEQRLERDSSQALGPQSRQLSQQRVDRELAQAARDPKMQPIAEALTAVQETRSAIDLLQNNDANGAKAALERALGKLDIILSTHPDLAFIPISIDLNVIDLLADDITLKRISRDIQNLVDDGRYQAARLLLRDFGSEIDLITLNLPVATYPDAIRSASRALEQNKTDEAMAQLLSALQTLVAVERPIPLPVVRAQALVEEVSRQANEKKISKEQAFQYLNDADQQLTFAENLGYGKRKEEFRELHDSLKSLKESIGSDQESTGLIDKLKHRLQSLSDEIVRR